MGIHYKGTYVVGSNSILDVLGELLLESLFILLLKVPHVFGDVLSEDAIAVNLCGKLL